MEHLGLSGDIVLVNNNYILKICNSNQERFIKNSFKQINFHNPFINSVPILEQSVANDKQYIKMPYFKCVNAIEWISNSSTSEIEQFNQILFNYFTSIIDSNKCESFDYSAWINKIIELQNKIEDIRLQEILLVLKNIKFNSKFYYGDNHGDFTLSNLFILVDEEIVSIYVIDFLETFIQSPINDLIKIRQDTKHLWTFNLLQDKSLIDHNKIMILLNYIDNNISTIIASDPALLEFYIPFQILNLIRIVPYNKDIVVFQYLKSEIEELMNEFNAYNSLRR